MSKETMSEKTGGTAGETAAETSGKEFIVDPAYTGYVFVGCAMGRFEVDLPNGQGKEKRPYYNMYVMAPVSDFVSDDYQAFGMKAEKKKCVSPDVWKDLKLGCRVRLFFDDKKTVIMAALDE